ncbi:hypothetical protein B566_EDAN015078 [Ephemera danica]|nr:hypothetical protein B566_EDAN015078 [Ephemera danica]
MQNPNDDTQWNDILRSKGIIPGKQKEKEITEDEIVSMVENTVAQRTGTAQPKMEDLSLDELDELEDEEDERVLADYRAKRIAEMKALAERSKYGDVREISAEDYVAQVNKAGEGVWVVLHLYKQGYLAAKFPATKFIRSVSTTCIPNYPDKNLPTIFVYFEGELKSQLIGPIALRGMNLSLDELEWLLKEAGAVESKLTEDPKPKVKDVLMSKLRGTINDDDGDDINDW